VIGLGQLIGEVSKGFPNAGVSSKGIDIKAKQGALVKAAADGTVVYGGQWFLLGMETLLSWSIMMFII